MADNTEDSGTDYIVPPDFEALYAKNAALRQELACLHEELEYLDRILLPATRTTYMIKVGVLRLELLQLQVDVMKLRRAIALHRSCLQQGDAADKMGVGERIDREFLQWDERLRYEVAQIEMAKAAFSSLAVVEDEGEIRALYRALCRKMHPEIGGDRGPEAKSLWENIHTAYAWNDLFHLKALQMIAEDYPDSYDLPNDIGGMRRTCDNLGELARQLTQKLENRRQEPVFEWRRILDDPVRLTNEQEKLRNEAAATRLQKLALQDMLRTLESKDACGQAENADEMS